MTVWANRWKISLNFHYFETLKQEIELICDFSTTVVNIIVCRKLCEWEKGRRKFSKNFNFDLSSVFHFIKPIFNEQVIAEHCVCATGIFGIGEKRFNSSSCWRKHKFLPSRSMENYNSRFDDFALKNFCRFFFFFLSQAFSHLFAKNIKCVSLLRIKRRHNVWWWRKYNCWGVF